MDYLVNHDTGEEAITGSAKCIIMNKQNGAEGIHIRFRVDSGVCKI